MRVDFEPDPTLYPFESRWFEGTAGQIHYIDEGTGTPILFLHGNPTWSFLYRGIVVRLRDRFRCIAVDYPGFGLSERPNRYGYTAVEHARAIGELVDDLSLQDFIVMGQDWGGPIGASIAAERSERVRGLVLGNTWYWPVRAFNMKSFSRVMSSPPMQWAIKRRNFFVERLIPLGTARKLTAAEMDQYRGVQPSPDARRGVAEFPRQLMDARPFLEEIARAVPERLGNKPLLLVWGMKDIAFPPKVIPRMRRDFADNVVVELPRAKHFIQEDAPEEIAEAIAKRFA